MSTQRGQFKLFTVRGIDVKAHWSWLLIVLLITFYLGAGYFPRLMPGESELTYWLLGAIASFLFFASVLLHEQSHSFVARARGLKVRDITLFIFGGASNIEEEPETPREEFLIAVVGPLTSFLLSGVFFLLALAVSPQVHHAGAGASAVLYYLAFINFVLALFNMIPGFPLDGGRVLRSIIWAINHNLQSATRIAGFIGQLVAYGFISWGLYETFFLDNFGGLWLAFTGWFLLNAGQQSVAGTVVRETLRGITVGQVMEPAPPVGAPYMTLSHLLTQFVLPYNVRAVPVAQDGQLAGIITLGDIKHVPQEEWGTVTVGQIMTGPDKLSILRPQDSLDHAMQLLNGGDFDQLPVADQHGRLVGMVTHAHLLRWMQIRDELKLKPQANA
ncbi:MAG: site-2 protease family protein [Chloroflexota bacterium]|nr:site-2 protease family protein [Chloroflexota bacterium]